MTQTIKCPNCKREFEIRSEAIIAQCKCGKLIEVNNGREKSKTN